MGSSASSLLCGCFIPKEFERTKSSGYHSNKYNSAKSNERKMSVFTLDCSPFLNERHFDDTTSTIQQSIPNPKTSTISDLNNFDNLVYSQRIQQSSINEFKLYNDLVYSNISDIRSEFDSGLNTSYDSNLNQFVPSTELPTNKNSIILSVSALHHFDSYPSSPITQLVNSSSIYFNTKTTTTTTTNDHWSNRFISSIHKRFTWLNDFKQTLSNLSAIHYKLKISNKHQQQQQQHDLIGSSIDTNTNNNRIKTVEFVAPICQFLLRIYDVNFF
jgi:hypothetical protein